MKKFLLILCLSCVLDVDAKLTLEEYKNEAQFFPPEMDLVNGYLLDREKILWGHRFHGPVEQTCDTKTPKLRFGAANKSNDPTTRVVIALFPSPYSAEGAETTLDTVATDSLTSCFGGETYKTAGKTEATVEHTRPVSEEMITFIAGMFQVANSTREKGNQYKDAIKAYKNSIREKNVTDKVTADEKKHADELIEKAFSIKKDELEEILTLQPDPKSANKDLNKPHRYCANLICDIVESVAQENIIYPENYTNYLICAYIWNVLKTAGDVTRLREKLFPEKVTKYSKSVDPKCPTGNEIFKKTFSAIVAENEGNPLPFLVGEKPVTNGITHIDHKSDGGSDCTETVVRELMALILSDGSGKIVAQRIPENYRATDKDKHIMSLGDFFRFRNDAKALVQDGSPDTRNTWFKVVEGLENIKYKYLSGEKYNGFQIKTGWKNILKVICSLLKKYKGNIDIEKTIEKVNNWPNTTSISVPEIENALNQILKIRNDVDLHAKAVITSEDGYKCLALNEELHDVFGAIKISCGIENNELSIEVSSDKGHSEFGRLRKAGQLEKITEIPPLIRKDGSIETFLIDIYRNPELMSDFLHQLVDKILNRVTIGTACDNDINLLNNLNRVLGKEFLKTILSSTSKLIDKNIALKLIEDFLRAPAVNDKDDTNEDTEKALKITNLLKSEDTIIVDKVTQQQYIEKNELTTTPENFQSVELYLIQNELQKIIDAVLKKNHDVDVASNFWNAVNACIKDKEQALRKQNYYYNFWVQIPRLVQFKNHLIEMKNKAEEEATATAATAQSTMSDSSSSSSVDTSDPNQGSGSEEGRHDLKDK